jgi:hypothetical protein
MGAADCVQARSGAQIVAWSRPLTCTNVDYQAFSFAVCSVVVLGVGGSSPNPVV